MHDIRLIRDDPGAFDAALARRGAEPVAQQAIAIDEERRAMSTRLQEAQGRRNEASKAIGKAMGQGETDRAEALKAEVAEIKQAMPQLEEQERAAAQRLQDILAVIPNIPADDVPDGADEGDNVEIASWGNRREFDFEPREHADIAPALGMDFETGAKLSGARFTFLRGNMARLHRALGQFMIDRQVNEHGYSECAPPLLVRDEAMYGTDKLPKFAEDSYPALNEFRWLEIVNGSLDRSVEAHNAMLMATSVPRSKLSALAKTSNPDEAEEYSEQLNRALRESMEEIVRDYKELTERKLELEKRRQDASLWLIPTAEVSLTASVMGEILDAASLPLRLTALTQCFRSEAGSAGRDTRGFIRQHQFEKCELVSVVAPEHSEAEHERMTAAAEDILQALGLPYRRMLLCTGDMGFGARKTYDLEVWLPGQNAFREISSCSNTGDFQARRMNARYRPEGSKKTEFVHTLNGSGLAVGRTLVAVIENYQQADGSVTVPPALHSYMGGVTAPSPTD